MRFLIALLLLPVSVRADQKIKNAHIVFEVREDKGRAARWELWTGDHRAHLRSGDGKHESFYDLAKERRLVRTNNRTSDEPILFGKALQREELFPRGVKLKRIGRAKVLGRACEKWEHQQKEVFGRAKTTWCVWNGLPLEMTYAATNCNPKCSRFSIRWKAVNVELDTAAENNLKRM